MNLKFVGLEAEDHKFQHHGLLLQSYDGLLTFSYCASLDTGIDNLWNQSPASEFSVVKHLFRVAEFFSPINITEVLVERVADELNTMQGRPN